MRRISAAGLALTAFISCSAPAKRINIPSGDIVSVNPALEDVMGQPSAFARRPAEDVAEQTERRGLEGMRMTAAFQPSTTFKFDKRSGLVFYEDGKRNGQVRKGLELIEEGVIGKDRSKDSFTLYTKDGSLVSCNRSGIISTLYGPGQLERPVSK